MCSTVTELRFACWSPMRHGWWEEKVGLFRMPAFRRDSGLLSQRPSSPFLEQSGGFIATQEEAEQRKWGVSHATCPGECLLGPGLFYNGYLELCLWGDSYVI